MTNHAGTWKDYGNCASIGPSDDIWYPAKGGGQTRDVVTICSACTVQYECLTTALADPASQDHGFWASTSEQDRQVLRRTGHDPAPRQWLVSSHATPGQATAARRHHHDGRSIAWISYALRLTGPAVRAALRDKTKAAA